MGRFKRRFSTIFLEQLYRLRCCQLRSTVSMINLVPGDCECHKLLMVVGQLVVDHTHRRDLYSAARPSRRNDLITK